MSLSFSANASIFSGAEKPVLVASKREVIIPAKAKLKACAAVEKEVVKQRRALITRLKLNKQRKTTAENEHQVQVKRMRDEAKLAKEKIGKQIKLYKPEDVRVVQDSYNASVDSALDADEKAFSTAIKNYRTRVDSESVKISSLFKNHIKNLRKMVCDRFGAPTEGLVPEGFFTTLNESAKAFSDASVALRIARDTGNKAFRTAARNAEKTKNDSLKPLKKIK
jgi:hypothetical protein